jgi:GNAT superfamily N-acetyltransferase
MFIGWLKHADVSTVVEIANEVGWLVDGYHIKLMLMHSPNLSYGAYENGKLVGVIMAIEFEKSAMIKYFMVKPFYQRQGVGKRLFETLFFTLQHEYASIYLHANPQLEHFFHSYSFVTELEVGRYINVGKIPPFNFTNAHAKELESHDFDQVMKALDQHTFKEHRLDFLFDEMERTSSLKFALPHGFQHSSVVNSRSVYLGPWQVEEGAYDEAEKLLRGVLYFRGLKKIIADIPLNNEDAKELYEKYHFANKERFYHMVWGEKRDIKYENIYAFSL